jgi:hypothetical protein
VIDKVIENINSMKAYHLESSQFVYVKDFLSVNYKDSVAKDS